MGKILTSEHRPLGSLLVGGGALRKGCKDTELEGTLDLLRDCAPLWSGSHLMEGGL